MADKIFLSEYFIIFYLAFLKDYILCIFPAINQCIWMHLMYLETIFGWRFIDNLAHV